MVIATRDIGLGILRPPARTVTAVQAAEKLGFPEARIPLASVVIDLCLSPNQILQSQRLMLLLADIRQGSVETFLIIYVMPNAGAKELNRGIGYQYPIILKTVGQSAILT